jgi:glutathione reductase (NADPH)
MRNREARMADFDYDLFVIGGGSGGVRAARMAAQTGARVGIAEEYRFGGTCVIRGCVPKKLMVYASGYAEHFEDAEGFGWEVGERRFHWDRFMAAKNAEITRLEGIYARNLDAAGVELHRCRATVVGPHEVCLTASDQVVRAKHILIATGGAPFVPEVEGAHHAITSNEAFELPHMPKSVVVVGGGYIACEFACIFNGLGADVALAYRGGQILRGFDDDLRHGVAEEMRKKGVEIHTGEDVARIERDAAASACISRAAPS